MLSILIKHKGIHTMKKYNLLASIIENNTTASMPLLLEDKEFKNLFIKEIKSTNSVSESVKKLSEYANNYLI